MTKEYPGTVPGADPSKELPTRSPRAPQPGKDCSARAPVPQRSGDNGRAAGATAPGERHLPGGAGESGRSPDQRERSTPSTPRDGAEPHPAGWYHSGDTPWWYADRNGARRRSPQRDRPPRGIPRGNRQPPVPGPPGEKGPAAAVLSPSCAPGCIVDPVVSSVSVYHGARH